MSLIPGTTPTLTISLDTSISGCSAMQLCLVCGDARIVREQDELVLSQDGTEVSARLTQAETLLLPDDKIARVQLRVMLHDAVLSTEVMTVSVKELLYRKELIPHET